MTFLSTRYPARLLTHQLTHRLIAGMCACLAALFITAAAGGPAAAQDFTRRGVEDLVSNARRTLRDIEDTNRSFQRNLEDAVGIMIFPNIIKAGFIIAIEGGAGVLLSRYEDLRNPPIDFPIGFSHEWSAPAFFNLAAGSVGFQIGASGSQVIFLFMSERAFERALDGNFEVGAEINITIVGEDERTGTVFENADVLSYARAGGLFAGIAFEGANVDEAPEANDRYYDIDFDAEEIVTDPFINNSHADRLRDLLSELGARR
ncbi:MAG: lipid-binding SYLF domain-containing protein [Alphaproteobacteria bacterium]|nr:lipid-binding SYLF domain-containing protein [Alphaproteobacteria bacterium]